MISATLPTRNDARSVHNSMRAAALVILLFCATGFDACFRSREGAGTRALPQYMPQITSLSIRDNGFASLVLAHSRDLLITEDGGATWVTIGANSLGSPFESVTFFDPARGWAVDRYGKVFITEDLGKTWKKIAQLGNFTGAEAIDFVSEKEGWIRGFLEVWHTSDGGINWEEKLSTLTTGVRGQPSGMFPAGSGTLIVSGTAGQVYLTQDAGNTWKIITLKSDAGLKYVWFTDRQNGWVVGYVGGSESRSVLFSTHDGGSSWQEIAIRDSEVFPQSMCFVDNEAWIAGNRRLKPVTPGVSTEPVLVHSTDGGQHWNLVQIDSSDAFFNAVRFSDKDHGWLAGRDNFYRTEDGGKTWRRVLSLAAAK